MKSAAPVHAAQRVLVGLVVLLLTACAARSGDTTIPPEPETAGSTVSEPVVDLVGEMTLEPSTGPVGTTVSVHGAALPPSASFDLTWTSYTGSWDLQGDMNEEFHGRVFTPTTEVLGTVTTDTQGNLETTFDVPEGFGFAHDVMLADGTGVVRNKALFNTEMEVAVSPTEGPVGTAITIEMTGLGVDNLENNRQILYDNRYVGWVSAVTTEGHAVATITATGGVGQHEIVMARGAFTFPYLNPQQSPRPDIPVFRTTFTVTDGEPAPSLPIEAQNPEPQPRPTEEHPGQGQWLSTDLSSGPVSTPLTFMGGGFEPGQSISLAWHRIVGNRVSGSGWDEQAIEVGEATAGPDGTFELPMEVPHDVGGPHRIEALVDGSPVVETLFDVTVAAQSLPSDRVSRGDIVTIGLTGVGWTETANIYTVVYDNAYIGYACGFNSQGDVSVELTATGEPGWHFIDLYPAIYKGEEKGVQSFRIPQLTYADDHPGEDLPAFRYAFFIQG